MRDHVTSAAFHLRLWRWVVLDDYGQVAGTVEIFHAWGEMGQDAYAQHSETKKPVIPYHVLPGGVE